MWFTDAAAADMPEQAELRLFVQDVRHCLLFILEDRDNFGFLWRYDPSLYARAMETTNDDIVQLACKELEKAIVQMHIERLSAYGLEGRLLKFKIEVLNAIANQWKSVRRDFSLRLWLRQLFDAIAVILDPLIEAANGAGRPLKEFKDTMSALI